MNTVAPLRPIVGVMGSGSSDGGELAASLGSALATLGVHLLTGAGRGTMTTVARAFVETPGRAGLSIGIVPSTSVEAPEPLAGYPNPWIEIPIMTHLPHSGPSGTDTLSRNHINVLTSSVVIALRGAEGTRSEVELAVRYRKPVAWLLAEGSEPTVEAVPVFRDVDSAIGFVRTKTGATGNGG
ncbi:MAG: DNA-binding protein [Planctomycetota bacterium]